MTAWLQVLAKVSRALFSWPALPYLFFPFCLPVCPLFSMKCWPPPVFSIFSPHLFIYIYNTSTLLLLSCWFSDSVVHYCLHCLLCSSSSTPLAYRPTHPNSLAALSPFIPLSSSSSLRGTAELFIKQTSGICQESGPVSAWLIFLPTCVFCNDQLSVVLLPALPPLSISCHCSIQRLNLSTRSYSALSSLSSDKIYVGIP